MKKSLLVCSFLLLMCNFSFAQKEGSLALLKSYMLGSFNSAEQAAADTSYFDINLEMKEIWKGSGDGYWLYVEQAVSANLKKPYRQRVYHLEDKGNGVYTSSIYTLSDVKPFIGAGANPAIFDNYPQDSLTLLEGCAIKLTYDNGTFKGSTNEDDCKNNWGKASYATSDVVINAEQMLSWDQGWNDEGEQVWGAEKGGYVFVKQGLAEKLEATPIASKKKKKKCRLFRKRD